MGLYRLSPSMSGRMGTLRTLASIRDAALVEYGCMGHLLYGRVFMNQAGIWEGCKLYSTHIDEADISLGDISRLKRAIGAIIKSDSPRAIFLLPSAVPTVIGTDLSAICRELKTEFPEAPLIPFGHGGFDVSGYRGVEQALLLLTKTLPLDVFKTTQPTYNIIGSCADMFRFHADAQELQRTMSGAFGMRPVCVMTSDTNVTQLEQMGSAHINLVIRREGLSAARHLHDRFGTPYLFGRPYGITGTLAWIDEIAALMNRLPHSGFIRTEKEQANAQLAPASAVFKHFIRSHPDDTAVSIGGHADVVHGILNFAVNELLFRKGICWCDCPDMTAKDIPYLSEGDWMQAVSFMHKGLLMGSAETLSFAGRGLELQIANPDAKWRLSPYEPPFVGFRGAVHLAGLWLNASLEKEKNR